MKNKVKYLLIGALSASLIVGCTVSYCDSRKYNELYSRVDALSEQLQNSSLRRVSVDYADSYYCLHSPNLC